MTPSATTTISRDTQPATAVIDLVASNKSVDPIELTPLYNVIDPDALNTIFSDTHRGSSRAGSLTFPYEGYGVTVSWSESGAEISLEPSASAGDATGGMAAEFDL